MKQLSIALLIGNGALLLSARMGIIGTNDASLIKFVGPVALLAAFNCFFLWKSRVKWENAG